MSDLLAVLVVGAGSYFSRAVFILALARRRIPASLLLALEFVGPAVLSALVVALMTDGDGRVAIGVVELIAFAVAGVVAYLTRSHVYTLIAGMTAFWALRAIM